MSSPCASLLVGDLASVWIGECVVGEIIVAYLRAFRYSALALWAAVKNLLAGAARALSAR